jgi:ketopantoate hydroxymethyltransferase
VKRYADLGAAMTEAARAYIDEVHCGKFPAAEHSTVVKSARGSLAE